ncbi:MAG: EamA family transporter [Lachnospiraceae bacterium]|nr:EamA family transporter [Lachnospiraceae bacterium]
MPFFGLCMPYKVHKNDTMLAYSLAVLSVILVVLRSYTGRKMTDVAVTVRDIALMNAGRTVFGLAAGFILAWILTGSPNILVKDPEFLKLILFAGITNGLGLIVWYVAVERAAFMLVTILCSLSIFVPIVMSAIVYREAVTLMQFVGLLILIASFVLITSYNKDIRGKTSWVGVLAALGYALVAGMTDFSQKVFQYKAFPIDATIYSIYTTVVAMLTLTVSFWIMEIRRRRAPGQETEMERAARRIHPDYRPFTLKVMFSKYSLPVGFMAFSMFMTMFLNTFAAKTIPSVILYPLLKGGELILSMVVSAVLLKEKPNWKCGLGVLMAAAAMVIINVFK